MTNYKPSDARVTLLFQKRKVNGPIENGIVFDGKVYVLELLPYYRIRFDTDVAGESISYLEPYSEREGSLSAGDTDLPSPYSYPIEAIEIVDAQPSEVFKFNTGA